MTDDELLIEMAKGTRLKSPRDRAEWERMKSTWDESPTLVDATHVDAVLARLQATKGVERMSWLKRVADELPYDVVMALNHELIKRDAYHQVVRSLHEEKQAEEAGAKDR